MSRRLLHTLRLHRRLAVLAVLGLCAPAVHAAGGDKVVLHDGTTLADVTVLKADHDAVAVDTTGDGAADRTLKGGEVARIDYEDSPMDYRRGLFRMGAGEYDDALARFSAALRAKEARAFWLEPEARYMIAECLRLKANDAQGYREAEEAFRVVLETAPKSLAVPRAMQGIGRCLLGADRAAEAERQFDKLIVGEPYGREWALHGKLGKARALSAQGKADAGVKLAAEVMEATKGTTMVALHATAEDTWTDLLFAAGEYAKVRAIFQAAADAAAQHEVAARAHAYNRIGDTYLAENAVKDALLAYLRVRVLYPNDDEELARALCGAARCFTLMKKSREASELIDILKRDHGDSAWTARILAELGD